MIRNHLVRRWLVATAIVVLAGWTGSSMAQEKADPAKPKDIVDVAKATRNVQTFNELLVTAGLVDTLKGKGPYTVFIPDDAAFKKLGQELDNLKKPENKAKLQRMLKNHVVEGRKDIAAVKEMKSLKTMAGDELKITVKDEVVKIDKAELVANDMEASNGLIHVVDTCLMPKSTPEAKTPEAKP
jgi:uncharacterized surface protein with fasciclin (FAS1) repeats